MVRASFLALMLMTAGAFAQTGPAGIAFVQAPEQSFGVALGATPEEGIAGAIDACVEGGALAEDCIPTNWCQPAGWSVDVFVMHQEGLHWHETVCGLPNENVALSVAATLCDLKDRDGIAMCELSQVYNPEGTPQL